QHLYQIMPEDLKQQRLKYRVQVKLLGAVRSDGNKIIYVPSQRRLPHLGAKVALPSAAVLQELCRLSRGETELGDYVLGEFVYCGAGVQQKDPAMLSMEPKLKPESPDKVVKMRFRSTNTGFRAICAFHLLGEKRKSLKIAESPINIEQS